MRLNGFGKISCLMWSIWILMSYPIIAQNNISVANSSEISLDLTQVLAAGSNVETVADSTQWLNYSMVIQPTEPHASISIQISSGNIPDGIELYVEAGHYQGISRGQNGRSTGKILVDHTPRTLINNIGTSFTGHGRYVGHQLIFTFKVVNYGLLKTGDYSFCLQYTLNQ